MTDVTAKSQGEAARRSAGSRIFPPRRGIRTLHRWTGIAVGLILGMWLLSGILMVSGGGSRAPAPPARVDYGALQVSPAQAVSAAIAAKRAGAVARDVSMLRVGDVVAYKIATSKGPVFVDATTGSSFRITVERAASLVSAAYPAAGAVKEAELLTRQSPSYVGPVPVFRVRMQEDPAATYLVSPADGRVTRTTRLTPVRRALISMHDFSLVTPLTGRPNATRLLLLFALGTLALVLTGYYLGIRMLRK